VDGPSAVNGVARQALNFKSLSLTDIVIKIGRGARLGALLKGKRSTSKSWKRSFVFF
jgi:ribosomal protein L14E/L6E/L27E